MIWFIKNKVKVEPQGVSLQSSQKAKLNLPGLHDEPKVNENFAIQIKHEKPTDRYMIHPLSPWKIRWNILIALVTLYSVIIIPFNVGFSIDVKGVSLYLETIVDFIFFVDILFIFNTYIIIEGTLVFNRKLIAKEYLKSWFILDIVSTIPLDAILTLTTGNSQISLKFLGFLRLFRLLKLARLLKLKRLFSIVEETTGINPAALNMISVLLRILFLSHLLACCFFYIGNLNLGSYYYSWITAKNKGFQDQSTSAQYIASLYWSMTTLATVGYGDITPSLLSYYEIPFAIVTEMIGSAVFGFVIANISILLESFDLRAKAYDDKMREIKNYIREVELPSLLAHKVKKYYIYYLERKSLFNEEEIVNSLSPSLRVKLLLSLNENTIKSVDLLAQCNSKDFLAAVVARLRPLYYLKDSYIVKQGDLGKEMFFLLKGVCEVIVVKSDDVEISVGFHREGAYFGEISLITKAPRSASIRASTHCDIVSLSKKDLDDLFDAYPDQRIAFEGTLKDRLAEIEKFREQNKNYSVIIESDDKFEDGEGRDSDDDSGEEEDVIADVREEEVAKENKKKDPSKELVVVESSSSQSSIENKENPKNDKVFPLPNDENAEIRNNNLIDDTDNKIFEVPPLARRKSLVLTDSVGLSPAIPTSDSKIVTLQLNLLDIEKEKEKETKYPHIKRKSISMNSYDFNNTVNTLSSDGKVTISIEGKRKSIQLELAVTNEIYSLVKDEMKNKKENKEWSSNGAKTDSSTITNINVMDSNTINSNNLSYSSNINNNMSKNKLIRNKNDLLGDTNENEKQNAPNFTKDSPKTHNKRKASLLAEIYHEQNDNNNDNKKYYVMPASVFKIRWDALLALCILYSAIVIPFRISFELEAVGGFAILESAMDYIFGLDILISFRTAFFSPKTDLLVFKWDSIAIRYIKGWFVIDFFSTVPMDLFLVFITGVSTSGSSLSSIQFVRILRMARLIKLVRIIKLAKVLDEIEDYIESVISPAIIQLCKLFLEVSFIAHMMACFFFFVPTFDENIYNWKEKISIINEPVSLQYLISLYWAFTTMTTIGYGDVVPILPIERVYTIICQLIGVTVFGYIVGSMARLVNKLDESQSRQKEKVDQVKCYLSEKRCSPEMRMEVLRYFDYLFSRKSMFDEATILNELSEHLRNDVLLFLYKDLIERMPFISEIKDATYLTLLITNFKSEYFTPGECIFKEGDIGLDLHLLTRGSVEIFNEIDPVNYSLINEGTFFGENCLLKATVLGKSMRAHTYCSILSLSKEFVDKTFDDYPIFHFKLMEGIKKYIKNRGGEDGDNKLPVDLNKKNVTAVTKISKNNKNLARLPSASTNNSVLVDLASTSVKVDEHQLAVTKKRRTTLMKIPSKMNMSSK